MKRFIAVIVALLMVAIPFASAQPAPLVEQVNRPFVEKLHFGGRGIGFPDTPADASGTAWTDNLKWINKIAAGVVKKGDETKKVGFMSVTDSEGDHRYHLRNLVLVDSTLTADIYEIGQGRETRAGSLKVTFKPISGKEAWAGTMVLGSWTGRIIILGHKLKISAEFKLRSVAEARAEGECSDDSLDDDCGLNRHFKGAKDDARSREFLVEECSKSERKGSCKSLIESRADAAASVMAVRVLPVEAMAKIEIRQDVLTEIKDGAETSVKLELEDKIKTVVVKELEIRSGSGSSGSGGSSGPG